jgi:predicted glycogen debranching enzyme
MSTKRPDPIRFGRETCGDLAQAERREWWLANGRGAYAAGTVAGTLTRRYHGLLIAPVHPPLGRMLVLAKAEATLWDGERGTPLYVNRWGDGTIEPRGYLHLESFELDGRMPVWRYLVGDLALEARVWMERGADTTYVAYRLEHRGGARPVALSVSLLANGRDHHGTTYAGEFHPSVEVRGERIRVAVPDVHELWVSAPRGQLQADHTWIENFALPIESERGLTDRDNHLCVGRIRFDLVPGEWTGFVASLHADASTNLEQALQRFRAHDTATVLRARASVPELDEPPYWVERLVLAADAFVFARPLPDFPDGESIIAGYPWFGDWGRDTMIALPGIALATGRLDTARRILETFARFVDRGMLPNVFPGAGETPEYNTVDAALWYVEAWRGYIQAGGDEAALRGAWPVLEDIIDWHCRGTRYGIGMDAADGLLRAGEPGVQLTWMDAKVGDWVVTPRMGKPVEINALWHNALVAMGDFAQWLKQEGRAYRALAQRVRGSFRRFARSNGQGLYDVLDGPDGDDPSVRPNQIFAVSLPASPLDPDTQRAVVEVCGRSLLTSCGLRSLEPAHPDYRSHYLGGVRERDGSYHQGPVWAWLLGHYALGWHRVTGDASAAQALLEPLRDHLNDAALGSVSEIFDGAPPHTPRGAPCQAWSVGCTLEAWWRLERAKAGSGPTAREHESTAAIATLQTGPLRETP